jgi:NAD(P)-dependent dehydrogenase (short-subunit alcohol dehydrogenase family)
MPVTATTNWDSIFAIRPSSDWRFLIYLLASPGINTGIIRLRTRINVSGCGNSFRPRSITHYNQLMSPLEGKVALITGGSSGIGRATAMRLAAGGAKVAVAARNLESLDEVVRELEGMGKEAVALPTDVTDGEQCRNAVEGAVARFGRLDILVCSAGLSMRAYFAGSDLPAMEEVMRVNFFGTFYCTYYAIPFVKQTRGSLVAVSSLTGLRGIPSYAIYGASKFAVQGLYDALRLELGRDGVHVGVISPGFVDTPLRHRVLGPDGHPWKEPPPPPFRIWPVEKCVDRIMRVIERRRAKALLPAFTGPLLTFDDVLARRIGDAILAWKFPPDRYAPSELTSPRPASPPSDHSP